MIAVVQNGDVYQLKFKYDPQFIELLKLVPGRVWSPNEKIWTIPKDRLGFLVNQLRGTVYENSLDIHSDEEININSTLDSTFRIPDIDISKIPMYVKEGSSLYSHQYDFMKFAIDRQLRGNMRGFILADDPGCVAGHSEVCIKEQNKPATRRVKISTLARLINEDPTIQIKCMANGRFAYFPIRCVVDKGEKSTIKIRTEDTQLECTPDHPIYTPRGWIAAGELRVGDEVFTNGQQVCPLCGSSKNLIFYPGAKFYGYCRRCMYKSRNGTKYNDLVKKIDSDGYIRLFGKATRSMPTYSHQSGMGVYEHHQVWYEHTGHVVDTSIEAIHHRNGIKTDNRIENLELVTHHEHAMRHQDTYTKNLPQYNDNLDYIERKGTRIYLVPKLSVVQSIEECSLQRVWDISIGDPDIHNFICNNIVVHNCGKTLEVINLAIYNKKQYGMKHCLIICCVNSSKYNWHEDIEDHTQGEYSGYILGSRRKRNGHIKYDTETSKKLEDLVNKTQCGSDEPWPFFIILNIEALRYKVGKSYPIADEIIKLINSGEIGMIAVDEIHKNTSHTSQQGKQLLRIYKSQTRTISWIPMTGTPIVNKPTDVFLPLRLVGGHDFRSFYQWAENFCIFGGYGDYEIVGYKNIPYLKSLLQDNMIRRRKEDVLDLPPKIYYTEYVENTGYQAKLYKQIRAELAKQKSEAVRLNHPDISFIRLRQVNGSPEIVDSSLSVNDDYIKYNAKLQRLMELLDDAISNGEKVLVFSNWVEPLRTLYRFVSKKYKTCCFTGTMSESDRQKNKRVFQNNPDYKVLLGTIGAAGTTHTFTAASTVIFYDEPWTPSDKSQAEDRAYRIGTTQSVKVYTIITQDTVDDTVHSLLYRKKGVSTYIVDNKLDLKNETVMYLLLGGE